MPTLREKIEQGALRRDQTGQLTKETPEEIQTLSGKMGLASAPVTPLGAQGIGANPHQAKMVGTPAQKGAALAASVQPGESLQDTLRRGQGNQSQQANVSQQAAMQKSEELRNLGGIGDRVNAFIETQRQKLAQATQAAQSPEVQAAQTFNGKDVSQIKPLLAQLRANPTDQQLMLQVNQALGYDVNTQLDPTQVDQLYESAVDSIARAGAGNVDDDLTVSDLVGMQDFGYDAPELAHLLGVPEDQVGQMSVAQIRDRVSQIQAEEYSTTQKLEEQTQSGQLGAAERALAREGAREASRVGTRSSEADVQHLEQQIQNADQVQFGGKSYNIDDLLSDDTISGIISNYLQMAPGSPERQQLEQTEPALTQFIQKNQALLHDASERLKGGAQTFTETQKYNKQLAASLPGNLAKLVAPEAGSLQASRIDVNSKPLLQYLQRDPQAAQFLQGIDDRDAETVASLNPDQLNQLFRNNGQQWKQYLQDKQTAVDLRNRANQARGKPDQMIDLVFDQSYAGGYNQMAADYRKERAQAKLGLPNNFDQYRDLDPNQDGEIEGPDYYLDKFANAQVPTLQDALAGKRPDAAKLRTPKASDNRFSGFDKTVADRLGPVAGDGKLTVDEVMRATEGLSDDEVRAIAERLQKIDNAHLPGSEGLIMESGSNGLRTRLEDRMRNRDQSKKDEATAALQKAQSEWDAKYGNLVSRNGTYYRPQKSMIQGAAPDMIKVGSPPPRPK